MTAARELYAQLFALAQRLEAIGLQPSGDLEGVADQLTLTIAAGGENTHQTARSVVTALWPTGSPEDVGRPEWWSTELGMLCARAIAGGNDQRTVSYATAAAMLGVARGTVGVMVTRGTLDSVPGQGVLRSAVLQRLGRGASTQPTGRTLARVAVEPHHAHRWDADVDEITVSPSGVVTARTPEGEIVIPESHWMRLDAVKMWAEHVTSPTPGDICEALTTYTRSELALTKAGEPVDADPAADVLPHLLTEAELAGVTARSFRRGDVTYTLAEHAVQVEDGHELRYEWTYSAGQ